MLKAPVVLPDAKMEGLGGVSGGDGMDDWVAV